MSNSVKQITAQEKLPALFIGIDGGGSKCRARLASSDESVSGSGISGRANPLQGLDRTIASIVESSQNAIRDAGLSENTISQASAGIGLAGVNLPSLYKQVSGWEHPFKEMFLTTDLHIACLGAHAWQDGAVIIAGTGSCGISISNGETKIYGAHGFPLGDQCSGAWIGLKAVSASLLAYDGLGPRTELCSKICSQLQVEPREISDLMANQPPKAFAKLAPLVFSLANAGDAVAADIVKEGADYLNKMANKINQDQPGRLSVVGGLRSAVLPWLDDDVTRMLSDPIHTPEEGALYFAKSEAARARQNCA